METKEPAKIKEEIKQACTKGLAEDTNGEFYQLYDVDKLYDLAFEQGIKSVAKKETV